MLKKFLLILAGLLSFIAFLIILAPAAPLWQLVRDDINQQLPDLKVLTIDGTIWEGRAELQYRSFPRSSLSWQLDPIELLYRTIIVQLKLEGMAHEFNADLRVTTQKANISNLRGFVGSSYLNAVSRSEGIEFSGQIEMVNINLDADERQIQSIIGQLYWPGGKIVSRTRDTGTRVFDLPILEGDFSTKDASIRLHIHHNRQSVIDIRLKPDGWILVAIKARLFDLAGLPWPSGTSLDDTVLEYEEKVI